MRRRLVALTVTISLLWAGQASALFDPWSLPRLLALLRIAEITRGIYKVAGFIQKATQTIKDTQELMYPKSALQEIGSVFQAIRDLRAQIDQLNDQWELPIDIGRFRDGLTADVDLLRADWEAVWGRAGNGPNKDIYDLQGWASNRRYNSAASVLDAHDQWMDASAGLAHQARAGGEGQASAGRSIRLAAVGEALQLQQASVENGLAAERLSAAQEALDMDRRDQLLAAAATEALIEPLTRITVPPPDPPEFAFPETNR